MFSGIYREETLNTLESDFINTIYIRLCKLESETLKEAKNAKKLHF